MPWVKTEDTAALHGKFFRAGVAAFGWWEAALGYCSRFLTNGFIPAGDVALVFPGTTGEDLAGILDRLAAEGVVHRVTVGTRPRCHKVTCRNYRTRKDGLLLHDFLDYQRSKKSATELRRWRSAAGRKGGKTRAERAKQNEIEASNKRSNTDRQTDRHTEIGAITTLSSAALDPARNGPSPPSTRTARPYRADARAVLDFLNEKTGRAYRPVDSTLRLIEARLASGATVADCRAVVARKWRAWRDDDRMRPFVRPATLFRASNFENYIGERERAPADSDALGGGA